MPPRPPVPALRAVARSRHGAHPSRDVIGRGATTRLPLRGDNSISQEFADVGEPVLARAIGAGDANSCLTVAHDFQGVGGCGAAEPHRELRQAEPEGRRGQPGQDQRK